MSSCRELQQQGGLLWRRAVSHRFLEECRNGSIPPARFNTWLVQDHLFASHFSTFVGSLLSKADSTEQRVVLCGGIGALADELRWFQAEAEARGLPLRAPLHPTCQRYVAFMQRRSSQTFAIHAVAFWAIECAYCEAWRRHRPMQQPYDQYAERWGSESFGRYVGQLEAMADEALASATEVEREEALLAFKEVCELEVEFWEMAYSAGSE